MRVRVCGLVVMSGTMKVETLIGEVTQQYGEYLTGCTATSTNTDTIRS